jgi:2'-5' RNA ligase
VDLQVGWTAVVVAVPAAEDLVARVRTEFGPAAAVCLPPHVSVLYPWLAAPSVEDADLADLAAICAAEPSFDLSFTGFGTFPGVLWLAPEPAEPFVRLTAAMARRWPQAPPYRGRHPEITPHLSVMDLDAAGVDAGDEVALKDVVERLTPWLPVVHRAEEASFVRYEGDACTTIARLPLGRG